jgi:hypothetical protein
VSTDLLPPSGGSGGCSNSGASAGSGSGGPDYGSGCGRLSPAPSATESALSPPSDVSKTESSRHLQHLGRIEEVISNGAGGTNQANNPNNRQMNEDVPSLLSLQNSVSTANEHSPGSNERNSMSNGPESRHLTCTDAELNADAAMNGQVISLRVGSKPVKPKTLKKRGEVFKVTIMEDTRPEKKSKAEIKAKRRSERKPWYEEVSDDDGDILSRGPLTTIVPARLSDDSSETEDLSNDEESRL